jgi:ribokinase
MMTLYNLGSINADFVYQVPHLPAPGETLAATSMLRGLGGKGANMSVAAARAAVHVCHIGCVGADGAWAAERLLEYGVDTRFITTQSEPTGHAIIAVDSVGENNILLYPGANHALTKPMIGVALSQAQAGDWLLLQNETNNQHYAAVTAKTLGLKVAYAAAPFDASAVEVVLDCLDLLVLNQVEAAQLQRTTGLAADGVPGCDVIVTLGAQGCRWHGQGASQDFAALPVEPVDTTGAGDTFTGYVLAGLERGMPTAQAISFGIKAAGIMVTRLGTADVIPDLKDLQDLQLI